MRWGQRQSRPTGPKRRILQRVAGLLRPHAAMFGLLVVLIVITATLDLVPALLVKEMVDSATGVSGGPSRIDVLLIVLVTVTLTSGLLGVGLGYVNQSIGQNVMYRLRRDLHAHLQQLSVRFYTQTRTGEILARVSSDVNAIQQAVTGTFTEFLQNAITLTVAVGLMFALEWRLALAAVVLLPLWIWPTMRVGDAMRRLMREWHEENANMSAHLEETLSVSGSMLVKTFGRQDHEAARFEQSNDHLRTLAIKRMMAGRWFNMGTGLFGALAPGIVYWFGGRAVLGDELTMGSVVAFAVLTQRVFAPFAAIARINTTLLSSLALFERIFEYLDLPVDVQERANAVALATARGNVRFEGVTFAYNDNVAPALDDVTFDVSPGEMVALVGPSGAGKTTTTYLLQRFYDPQLGRVLLDGHDLRDLTLDSVASAVGAVMQDTYLFHASLADNIRYGRLNASDAEVEAAANAAGLRDMTERLPEGLATVVGERGYRLSGGEKQRVAIARAILKDPPVLILDEATASLDSRLARVVARPASRQVHLRLRLVDAHRLDALRAHPAHRLRVLPRGASRVLGFVRGSWTNARGRGAHVRVAHHPRPSLRVLAVERLEERPVRALRGREVSHGNLPSALIARGVLTLFSGPCPCTTSPRTPASRCLRRMASSTGRRWSRWSGPSMSGTSRCTTSRATARASSSGCCPPHPRPTGSAGSARRARGCWRTSSGTGSTACARRRFIATRCPRSPSGA
jgi:ATP-binding cassette subfamily B protein